MTALSDLIESTARQIAAKLIVCPGWADRVEEIIPALADMLRATNPPHHEALAARAAVILRDMATGDPMDIICRYRDVLPPELVAEIDAMAVRCMRDCGADVEEFKTEEGETVLKVRNIEAMGVPADELERLNIKVSAPVGPLYRLH